MDQRNEVTIIGAGPAGIAAAIYLQRAELHPILLEKNEPGGLLRYAYCVENYPGFSKGIAGDKLVKRFVKQLHMVGVSITKSFAEHIDVSGNKFLIETNQGRLISSAVILATGTIPQKLSIRGAYLMEGIRLFYELESIPSGKSGVKKRIIVIGGGDIAFDYTLTLLCQGYDVTIVCRSQPKCLQLLHLKVINHGVKINTFCLPEEIVENRKGILLKCRRNDGIKEFSADLILVACGRIPNTTSLAPSLHKCLEENLIVPETSIPGFYLVGDVARKQYRQVGIAVGDGIRAAMLAERYIKQRM